ncbi:MAG: FecR domain-containing protein [Myxococcales bacterium]|nr:FecR domain-containing protein [Myxococcales bacterium]
MRRIGLILLVLLLAATVSAQAQTDEPRGMVIAADGVVRLERAGLPEPILADAGFEIFENDRLTTDGAGRAKLQFGGQLIVYVGSNTDLVVERSIHNLKDRARVNFFHLNAGSLRLLVRPRPNYRHTVRVDDPNLAAAGHNAYFVVEYDPQAGRSRIYNLAGEVRPLGREGGTSNVAELAAGAIVTSEDGKLRVLTPDETAAAAPSLLAETEVANQYLWQHRPGSAMHLVESRWLSSQQGGVPNDQGLLLAEEGEGGADFDAFHSAGLREGLREEDLPYPDDFSRLPAGVQPQADRVAVRIHIRFPEANPK